MIDLKEIRNQLGITQVEMAQVLGIGQAAYSRLENGGWEVSPDREREYMRSIVTKYPQFSYDTLPQAAVSFRGNHNKVSDVKVSSMNSDYLSLLGDQSRQISSLIETIQQQNEIIISLTQKLNK